MHRPVRKVAFVAAYFNAELEVRNIHLFTSLDPRRFTYIRVEKSVPLKGTLIENIVLHTSVQYGSLERIVWLTSDSVAWLLKNIKPFW